MTETTEKFAGLSMPVFTAFGWAGEETALQYALSQLELFIGTLHAQMSPALRNELPFYGLSESSQSVYLAANEAVEENIYVAFYARPLSFEMQLALTDKETLSKGIKQSQKDPSLLLHLLKRLGPGWTFRVQQMHINDETGEQGHHQDIFKDDPNLLDEAQLAEIIEKAAYLNGESQWVTPIYLSQRIPAEQAATMQTAIVEVMAERLALLLPLIMLLTGRNPRKKVSSVTKSKSPTEKKRTVSKASSEAPKNVGTIESFTYATNLKPLHIRRGFINMTPEHWPFFAQSARTDTRSVTVITPALRDKNSAVWRLQPSEIARLVLSPRVHEWLEDHFQAGDRVQLTASKVANDEIEIILQAVD